MSRTKDRGFAHTFVFGLIAVAASFLVVTVIVGNLFDVGLPFSQEMKDHSPPLILNEIRDLAEFHAGQAEFEVIVDRENDVKWVPSFIAGDRVQFVAVGTVDAIVDFSALGVDAIIFDEATNSATVILPSPVIGEPVIDVEQSGVMNRDRGVLDRLGGVFSDNPTAELSLIQEAEDKIAAAATQTDLVERAERTTEQMLVDLISALGVDDVRVVFERSVTSVE